MAPERLVVDVAKIEKDPANHGVSNHGGGLNVRPIKTRDKKSRLQDFDRPGDYRRTHEAGIDGGDEMKLMSNAECAIGFTRLSAIGYR